MAPFGPAAGPLEPVQPPLHPLGASEFLAQHPAPASRTWVGFFPCQSLYGIQISRPEGQLFVLGYCWSLDRKARLTTWEARLLHWMQLVGRKRKGDKPRAWGLGLQKLYISF